MAGLEIATFDGFQVAFRENTIDATVLARSFSQDRFFKEVPEYQPATTDIIVDVGAHIGTFSLLASSKVPRGKVYAIEACKESANLCRINAALNNAFNIHVSHLALSNESGESSLYHGRANWAHSIIANSGRHGKELVRTESLGGFVDRHAIARCHFMKLNCEGAEFPIILSTDPSILRRISILLILYHCDMNPQYHETDLLRHLERSGFRTTIRHRRKHRGWIAAIQNDGG